MSPKKEDAVEVHVANIVRHQGPIVLPDDMSTEQAIEVLQRRAVYDKEEVVLHEIIPVFVWDGALALVKALTEQFGMAQQTKVPGSWFMPDKPPQMVAIEIAPGKTTKVPWGRFLLPGIQGFVETGIHGGEGERAQFQVSAKIQHRHEDAIKKLFARTRELALSESIYRGKAFGIRFRDDAGERVELPEPKFIRLTDAPVIFNRDLEQAIETNIITPLAFSDAVRAAGIPLKRGALLAGNYGTGKTLTAGWVAKEATANGWTFIYVTRVEELAEVLQFAQDFQPAVVFAEDVDRAAGRERTNEVNELLNTLDGIGNKAGEIMVILTTNHPQNINPAMRRPGRIDIVLSVDPPDAEATVRLMRLYGGTTIAADEDLELAGELMKGHIPAVTREVVERAKLEAIRRSQGSASEIVCDDLVAAAKVLLREQRLFVDPEPPKHPMELLGETIGGRMAKVLEVGIKGALDAKVLEVGIKGAPDKDGRPLESLSY